MNIDEPETGFESDDEIEQKIINVVKEISVELKSEHISVAHRTLVPMIILMAKNTIKSYHGLL